MTGGRDSFRSRMRAFPLWIYGYVFHRYGDYYERFQGIKPAAQGFPGNLGAAKWEEAHNVLLVHFLSAPLLTTRSPSAPETTARRPPVLPRRPAPRPELSHVTLGNDRDTLFPATHPLLPLPQPLGWGFPALGAALPLGQAPQSPGAEARAAAARCRGGAQVRPRLTKLQACGSLK